MHPSAEVSATRTTNLFSLSRTFYLIAVVLALVVVIPTAWFPVQLGKVALFATFLALSGICFVLAGGMHSLRGSSLKLVLYTGLLPIIYFVSWYFSIDRSIGLVGLGALEVNTVFFSLLTFFALLLGFALFRSKRNAALLFTTVFITLIVASIFQCIVISFGTAVIPFQVFVDRSVNLIGKWNDLGLLMGLLLIWGSMKLEWSVLSPLRRTLLIILMVALVFVLGLIQFSLVWALICAASVLFIAGQYFFSTQRSVPWYVVGVGVLSILFLIFGTTFSSALAKAFPVTSLEVRPSYLSTVSIISAAHPSFARTILGSGPDTFRQEWIVNRPQAVNLSTFWNLDFSAGYSTLLTILSDVGYFGALLWLIPLLLSLLALRTLFRSNTHSAQEKILGIFLGVGAIYIWVASGFYVLSQDVILLAFVLTGALLGSTYTTALHPHTLSRIKQMGMWMYTILFLISLCGLAYVADRLLISESYTNQGLTELSNGNIQQALVAGSNALHYQKTPEALGLVAQAQFSDLQTLAASSTQTADAQTQFINLAQQIISETKEAIGLSPEDYRSYVLLGQVYSFLSTLQVQGAYQLAQSTYAIAAQKNPTNPEIPLLQATLEAGQNNLQGTQQFLQESLTLKQNFTNAILFIVQLDVAQKDLPHAIAAAQAAVQSAPNVASIWFELGVLYYNAGDAASAVAPLQQAIHLQNNYANAEYYLGLSYYAEGSTTEAIAEFTQLAASNPDSQEVSLILQNMRTGKAPFTAAKTATTTQQ